MQEKKGDAAASSNKKNPKKANLLDHGSIKHLLDESVSEVELHFLTSDFNRVYWYPACEIRVEIHVNWRWIRFWINFFLVLYVVDRDQQGVHGGCEAEQH